MSLSHQQQEPERIALQTAAIPESGKAEALGEALVADQADRAERCRRYRRGMGWVDRALAVWESLGWLLVLFATLAATTPLRRWMQAIEKGSDTNVWVMVLVFPATMALVIGVGNVVRMLHARIRDPLRAYLAGALARRLGVQSPHDPVR